MARQNEKKTTGGRDENQSQSRNQHKNQQQNNTQNQSQDKSTKQEKSNSTSLFENELDDFGGIPSYGAFLKDMHYDDWDDGDDDLPIEKSVQLKKSEANKKRKQEKENKSPKKQENKTGMTKPPVTAKTPQPLSDKPKKQQPIESWVLEDEFLFEGGDDSLALPSYGRMSHPADKKKDHQQTKESLSRTVSQKKVPAKHDVKHGTDAKEKNISSSQNMPHKKKTVQQLPETSSIVLQHQEPNTIADSLLHENVSINVSDKVLSNATSKGSLISLRIDASKKVSEKSSRKERALRKAARSEFGGQEKSQTGLTTGDMTPLVAPSLALRGAVVVTAQLPGGIDAETLGEPIATKQTDYAQVGNAKRTTNDQRESAKSTKKPVQSESQLKSNPKKVEFPSKNKEGNVAQLKTEVQQSSKGDKSSDKRAAAQKTEKQVSRQRVVDQPQRVEGREATKSPSKETTLSNQKQSPIAEKQDTKPKDTCPETKGEHLKQPQPIQKSPLPSKGRPQMAQGSAQSPTTRQVSQQTKKEEPSPNGLPASSKGDHHKTDNKDGKSPKGAVRASIDNPNIAADAEGKNQPFDFGGLKLSNIMLESLKAANYREPSPVQAGIIPEVLAGHDVMGQARTGTGKTAAFVIPILEGLDECDSGDDPVALVLVPTRELAVQVRDEAAKLAQGRNVRTIACYGGKPIGQQISKLKGGADLIIGTPGRILDLSRRGALTLDSLIWVVLDEADRMLDIGFRPDIEKILRLTPSDRQTLLLSATLPTEVIKLAERYMRHPKVIDFSDKQMAVETIEQYYITIDRDRKSEGLIKLLKEQNPKQVIVFCRTKRGADRVKRQLEGSFQSLESLHGDMSQNIRDRVMSQFRAGKVQILVATDVVGRGIDISGISHIINYDIPQFCDDYVHRVGRTGRMGREGVAYTFVTAEEGQELTRIEMRINQLLKRAELKDFEAVSQIAASEQEESKPVFGRSQRRVRKAL